MGTVTQKRFYKSALVTNSLTSAQGHRFCCKTKTTKYLSKRKKVQQQEKQDSSKPTPRKTPWWKICEKNQNKKKMKIAVKWGKEIKQFGRSAAAALFLVVWRRIAPITATTTTLRIWSKNSRNIFQQFLNILTIKEMIASISATTITTGYDQNCRSLIKVKFSTAHGSGCCLIDCHHAQKTSKLPYFRLF